MKRIYLLISILVLSLAATVSAKEQLTVYTVNYPLAYFAERIGSVQVEVVFPAPDDVDPAYWMPDAETIAAYQRADLVLLNGANYAKWVGKVSLPYGKMVDTSRSFQDRYVYASEVTTHSHGSSGAHAHESLAFTTWLDFSLAKQQAETIYKALVRKKPEAEASFKDNFKLLANDLDKLDRDMKTFVKAHPGLPLVGSHPVYDYLSAGYGLNLKSVHWEPDEFPTITQWQELERLLEQHPATCMLWEGEPFPETVERLKALSVNSIIFSPSANRPSDGDFLTVMRTNLAGLEGL